MHWSMPFTIKFLYNLCYLKWCGDSTKGYIHFSPMVTQLMGILCWQKCVIWLSIWVVVSG